MRLLILFLFIVAGLTESFAADEVHSLNLKALRRCSDSEACLEIDIEINGEYSETCKARPSLATALNSGVSMPSEKTTETLTFDLALGSPDPVPPKNLYSSFNTVYFDAGVRIFLFSNYGQKSPQLDRPIRTRERKGALRLGEDCAAKIRELTSRARMNGGTATIEIFKTVKPEQKWFFGIW